MTANALHAVFNDHLFDQAVDEHPRLIVPLNVILNRARAADGHGAVGGELPRHVVAFRRAAGAARRDEGAAKNRIRHVADRDALLLAAQVEIHLVLNVPTVVVIFVRGGMALAVDGHGLAVGVGKCKQVNVVALAVGGG